MDNNNLTFDRWSDYQIHELPCSVNSSPSILKKNPPKSIKDNVDIKALISPGGLLCFLPSLYLRSLTIGEDRVEDTGTAAYALLAFYRYLHDAGLDFDDLSASPEDGPLFGFRYYLCENIKSIDNNGDVYGTFSTSTIKSYLGQIANYYEWLVQEELLEVSENHRPLTYSWKVLKGSNDPLLAHVYRKGEISFKRKSLLVGLPKEQKTASYVKVNPLSDQSLKLFRNHSKYLPEAIQLAFEMQILCGLRLGEVATFSEHHIVRPDARKKYKCRIGPNIDGCHTKYKKIRTIEIPVELMAKLYEHKLSKKRQINVAKSTTSDTTNSHPKNELRIFLSNRGKPYSKKSISGRFSDIRKKIRQEGYIFDHKDHDLRRTFATNWIAKESKESGNSFFFVASGLMELMGHNDFSATEKYVKYVSKENESIRHAERLNQIAEAIGKD